jgi:poly [ADP-ribose] polymerase 1
LIHKLTLFVPRVKGIDKKAVKKAKLDKKSSKASNDLEERIAQQTKEFFAIRDNLKKFANAKILQELLKLNGSNPIQSVEKMLDRCADFITFGAIVKCSQCKTGDMVFEKHGYRCNGKINEWADCKWFEATPKRFKCKIPDSLKASNKENRIDDYLTAMTVRDRAVREYVKQQPISNPNDIKVQRKREPLYNMHVVPIGLPTSQRPAMKRKIESMGGKLVTKLQPMIAFVISTPEVVEKMGKRMEEVEKLKIQVVDESFLDAVANGSPEDTIESIKELEISDWGSDPLTRIPQEETRGQRESLYTRGVSKVANMKMKNGVAIDPASGLADKAHVYQREGVLYTTVLGFTDIQKNKNSYFKIQVLQSDDLREFWIFSSWGRIGTKIGDSSTEQCSCAGTAVGHFEQLYRLKTGNQFNSGKEFVKQPGKFYPIDIDYEEDDSKKKMLEEKSKIPSKLSEEVQDLVKMLFDVNVMNQMMVEFKLDLERMPLGRLSKKQLQEANETLKELSELIVEGAPKIHFVAMSNKFYTLVPHSFGMKHAPVIDTLEMIKEKTDMIESLLEIEIAYSMLQEDIDDEKNPLDHRYDQLKTEISALDRSSKEFKLIEQYVANTHAETHNEYKIEIEEVFKVDREGEKQRYKPFKKLHNRQLLWHGSRLTNFVGILKNGLRIAPPEAPVTGYMFGKGVYFADSVSKSANYCFATKENNSGLMLLSEVALGDTYDLTRAQYITKLPDGKHSTKGVGKTYPDPQMQKKAKSGLIYPLGKLTTDVEVESSLLYNEFIVYDPAQINVKYLLKMKFDFDRK